MWRSYVIERERQDRVFCFWVGFEYAVVHGDIGDSVTATVIELGYWREPLLTRDVQFQIAVGEADTQDLTEALSCRPGLSPIKVPT